MVNARTSGTDAESVCNEIRHIGGRSAFKLGDVGDPGAVAALVQATIESFGRIDILVNNASVRREIDFVDLDYQEWREILSTTLDAAYCAATLRCRTSFNLAAAPSSTLAGCLRTRAPPGALMCSQRPASSG